jgi:predicted kinase
MAKLYLLKGLPASGKSTKAKELVEQGAVRVNRDLLREMMNFGVFKYEDMVVDTEKFVVCGFLGQGRNIVIDDCNLNPANKDMWENIARLYNASLEVIEIDTPMDECIERDKGREKKVGEHVIRNMALQYGKHSIKNKVVVCDIDGTIADIKHRLHFAKGESKDWNKFFEAMDRDSVRAGVREMLNQEEMNGFQLLFVSARPEDYREQTVKFLKGCGLPTEWLFMRPSGDKRDDTIVKFNIYNKYLKNLDVVKVYDDRPRVIRMWRELGLTVIDVGDGVEF